MKNQKTKYKSVITKRIQEASKKLGLALFALVFALSLYAIHGTNSMLMDTEQSAGNNFEAGSLDFRVTSPSPAVNSDVRPGNHILASNNVESDGDLDFQYKAAFHKDSGNDALCSALNLSAEKNGVTAYSGSLSGFNNNVGDLEAGENDNWTYDITLSSGSSSDLQNLECNFSFIFSAWQTDLSYGSGGFSDTESFTGNEIHSGDWTGPVISDREVIKVADTKSSTNGTNPKAKVIWTTDEEATSNVVYDTTGHPDCDVYPDHFPDPFDTSANKTSHSVEILNLIPGVTYHYRIKTTDVSGNETCSSDKDFTVPAPIPDAPTADVVLNEFVPNPPGSATDEWVELYNKGSDTAHVLGWVISDASSHEVTISTLNTDTGLTDIDPGHWLVVNLNTSMLNNSGGDTVTLKSGATVIDSHSYTGDAPVGKSYARFPDGNGIWVDPEDTPGKENKMADSEKEAFQKETFEKCFDGLDIKKSKEDVCNGAFLEYIGMLKDKKDKKMIEEIYLKFSKDKDLGVVSETEKPAVTEPVIVKTEEKEPEPDIVIKEESPVEAEPEVKPEEKPTPPEKEEAPKKDVIISENFSYLKSKIIYTLC